MRPGVRITGGTWRGRRLVVPAGARPSEGRVREALFSIWHPWLATGTCRLLDLFAGSGAVGLEAASRGAGSVLCVDESAAALRAMAENIANVASVDSPAGARLAIRRLTLPAGLQRLAAEDAGPFDLIFADPPYEFAIHAALLAAAAPLLAEPGELVIEHSARRELPAEGAGLQLFDRRAYGESALSFYRATP